ncbi:Dephospho-CoA kinase [uncultured archaeon]|nr:Dephospho-CoA kinase [uncultured archaeon]
MKIIGFVGMPGSGKSVASNVARNMGLEVVVMGDVIRWEAARLGLPPTDENLGNVGNMLRAREGPEAVAKRTLELARRSGKDFVVVDGLRSRKEVEFLRDNSNDLMLVEVCASAESRLSRIANRGRSDDANSEDETKQGSEIALSYDRLQKTAEALAKRECRELGWGMCEAFNEADLIIDNNGDLDEFKAKVEAFLSEIEDRS